MKTKELMWYSKRGIIRVRKKSAAEGNIKTNSGEANQAFLVRNNLGIQR